METKRANLADIGLIRASGVPADREILKGIVQPGDEWFVDSHATYSWYYAIGAAKRPVKILELGVRYGYAGVALASGGHWAGPPIYVGIDNQHDGIESNDIAQRNIQPYAFVQILKENTSDVVRVAKLATDLVSPGLYDVIHVDGDHSEQGILNELRIAEACAAEDAWILVDDIDTPHVLKAAIDFASTADVGYEFLPTFHGLMVIDLGGR